ncbi:MAG TPA: hypothetical protein VFF80_03305 [Bacillota bacterium]|nr:hypothetical protein [Bacillota bacterium]
MQKKFNKPLIWVTRLLIISLLLWVFVIPYTTRATDNQAISNDGGITTAVVSGLLPDLDYGDLMKESSLVIRGKVVDQSESFQIIPVFGNSPSNFADYSLQVEEVLRGNANPKDIVSARIQGGLVEKLNVIVEDSPNFNIGDQVLVFMYQPNMGSGYNTEGDYYYVLGVNQGAFYLTEKSGTTDYNIFSNVKGVEVEWDTAVLDFTDYNKENPVDENRVYNEFLENQKRNLDSGFITQAEYNRFLA